MTGSIAARQAVMLEFATLGASSTCPLGMYVLPTSDDVFTWQCVLFIHRGYFRDSVLRFSMTMAPTYPSRLPPTITFSTNVFHPLVDPATGRFHLGDRFSPWTPGRDYLFHVLHHVKNAFKREGLDAVQQENCGNPEAWKIYHDQTALFAKLASQTSALSITPESLYTPSSSYANSIRFDPLRSISFRPLEEGEEEILTRRLEDEAKAKISS
ncbi:BZ3500_MvSof-1268-A1-R1_Chr2-1g04698 [Microbotryum saponariae]|uniref:BZ3500_MvSof-1268-A1-R1_Chr2-1g04698 protein n=1 Tax=Microbotryum saponariae TaxID=289078 RepID=A0A2X0K791_9BASI|nr:BZ3500_MvSof-1268-A1-R1_Chr2-1g04698 [Microbotryum saponariae]SCZ92349.1 BZ3501_MvSof-1269-A2-R1_Chr2-1g04354 [Microbotryum saponariae]